MSCTVEARARVHRAARTIRDTVPTEAVDVIEPTESRHGTWTLEVVLEADGIPPEVSRELALAGLTYRPQPSQGPFEIVVATA